MNRFNGLQFPDSGRALDLLLKVTVLLMLAACLDVALRRRSPAIRHWLWFAALSSTIALPIFAGLLPAWRALPKQLSVVTPHEIPVALPAQPVSAAVAPVQRAAVDIAPIRSLPAASASPVMVEHAGTPVISGRPFHGATSSKPIDWTRLKFGVWICATAIALLPVLLGMLSLATLARRCLPATGIWPAMLIDAAKRLRMHLRVSLLIADRRAMPMTWGLWRPKLLLPAAATQWPEHRQRAVLLHELAHVKRLDCLADLIARLICCVYWFHPLAWFALWRMRDLREGACDDHVLACGSDGPQYAEFLLDIATTSPRFFSPALGIAIARRSNLRRRLAAILEETRDRSPLRAATAAMSLALLLALAAPLAMLRAGEPPATAPVSAQAGEQVEGAVIDFDGSPVVGAEVTGSFKHFEVETIRQIRTGNDGVFHLLIEPADERPLLQIRATAPGRAYGTGGRRLVDGHWQYFDFARQRGTDHFSIMLPPEARIAGAVVDKMGNPVPGAFVSYDLVKQVSDAQGHFLLEKVPPSRYGVFADSSSIRVMHPEYVEAEMRFTNILAGKTNEVRITLDKGVLLRGTLTDADTGLPIKHLSVIVSPNPMTEHRYYPQTNENGVYEIRVPAGQFDLSPSLPRGSTAVEFNYYPVIDTRTIRVAESSSPATFDFSFRKARSVSGKIIGADRLRLSELRIEIRPPGSDVNSGGQYTNMGLIAADGTFRILQLKPARYEVRVVGMRNTRSSVVVMKQPINVLASEDVTNLVLSVSADFANDPGVVLRGLVHFPDGKPAANAKLELMLQDLKDVPNYVRSDVTIYAAADGSFVFPGVDNEKPWALWAHDPSGTKGAAVLLTRAEQFNAKVDLTLIPGAEYSGTVRDHAGKGLGNYIVGVYDVIPNGTTGEMHRPRVVSLTDEEGHFVVKGFVAPEGGKGYVLETMPQIDRSSPYRKSQTSTHYENLDARPEVKHAGFDFEVVEDETSIRIRPKPQSPESRNP